MTKEELGGADVHAANGVVDRVAENETEALAQIREFLSYMPQNVWELSPIVDTGDPAFVPVPDETDIDGQQRVCGTRVDMGADELGRIADLNCDGLVNFFDIDPFVDLLLGT